MKILILGSGSFAGQALFSNLLDSGYEVIGINRSAPKSAYHWPWTIRYRNYIVHHWSAAPNVNIHNIYINLLVLD